MNGGPKIRILFILIICAIVGMALFKYKEIRPQSTDLQDEEDNENKPQNAADVLPKFVVPESIVPSMAEGKQVLTTQAVPQNIMALLQPFIAGAEIKSVEKIQYTGGQISYNLKTETTVSVYDGYKAGVAAMVSGGWVPIRASHSSVFSFLQASKDNYLIDIRATKIFDSDMVVADIIFVEDIK